MSNSKMAEGHQETDFAISETDISEVKRRIEESSHAELEQEFINGVLNSFEDNDAVLAIINQFKKDENSEPVTDLLKAQVRKFSSKIIDELGNKDGDDIYNLALGLYRGHFDYDDAEDYIEKVCYKFIDEVITTDRDFEHFGDLEDTGDPAHVYEQGVELRIAVKRKVLEVSSVVHIPAEQLFAKFGVSLDESNHPDDYDSKKNPHNASRAHTATIMDEIDEYINNPQATTDFYRVTKEWFDGEDDEAILNDLADDIVYEVGIRIERDLGADYVADDREFYKNHAVQLMRERFGLGGKIEEDALSLNFDIIKDIVKNTISRTKNANPRAIYNEIASKFEDSRTIGSILHKYKPDVMDIIGDALAVTAESTGIKGDDLIADVTYKPKSSNTRNGILARRKKAGL